MLGGQAGALGRQSGVAAIGWTSASLIGSPQRSLPCRRRDQGPLGPLGGNHPG